MIGKNNNRVIGKNNNRVIGKNYNRVIGREEHWCIRQYLGVIPTEYGEHGIKNSYKTFWGNTKKVSTWEVALNNRYVGPKH